MSKAQGPDRKACCKKHLESMGLLLLQQHCHRWLGTFAGPDTASKNSRIRIDDGMQVMILLTELCHPVCLMFPPQSHFA
jgi:hypothetical protein